MVSWANYQLYFLLPNLGNTKPFPPQNICHVPWILLCRKHRCVCTHNTLSTCSCFIAQLELKLWDCGNEIFFWNSLKKIKIKTHQNLERELCSPLASVGSTAQIQQRCGLQPQKRESPVWKCSTPLHSAISSGRKCYKRSGVAALTSADKNLTV